METSSRSPSSYSYTPYTLLAQIPQTAKWFAVLDLKDAFFCIPVYPDSQYLFVFEDPKNQSSQLPWTVLLQRFRDSPHLFARALSKDLSGFSYSDRTLLQYVDDLVLCASSEDLISSGTTVYKFPGPRPKCARLL